MRDVIFNEQERFSGVLVELRDEVRELDLDELSTLLQEYALPEEAEEQVNPALAPRGVEEALLDGLNRRNPRYNHRSHILWIADRPRCGTDFSCRRSLSRL
ncbi:hypothetical protein N657DRAFT_649806 [Parathielavia appendiculata]|uniref:Uncharacterized protein n=1 Tax=Parathielavia appendiculata TaxID=2587402 RepID=A0AAN6TSF6_9PEZI|nr:hypothetical protein N657DRAFT_649806 [Parathielavia appendiculata]